MKCLHCGYCCIYLSVMIIDDPAKGLAEGNIIHHPGNNGPCKHLMGDTVGEYTCAVHHFDWYQQTPCNDFDQLGGKPTDECRLGRYHIDKYKESLINLTTSN